MLSGIQLGGSPNQIYHIQGRGWSWKGFCIVSGVANSAMIGLSYNIIPCVVIVIIMLNLRIAHNAHLNKHIREPL